MMRRNARLNAGPLSNTSPKCLFQLQEVDSPPCLYEMHVLFFP